MKETVLTKTHVPLEADHNTVMTFVHVLVEILDRRNRGANLYVQVTTVFQQKPCVVRYYPLVSDEDRLTLGRGRRFT